MDWIDVSAPPGAGKSTLCDPLWHHRAITWDGLPPPPDWHEFLKVVRSLLRRVERHWSYIAAMRMNDRSLRKMATVARMDDPRTYIQTGLVQRGVGFGWRLNDMGESLAPLRDYFETMPVSLGAAFLTARPEVLIERNRARELVPATAHENRDFQVLLQLPAIELAKEVLDGRGVPHITVSTEQPIEDARAQLVDFASHQARLRAADGLGREVEAVPQPA